VVLVALVFEMSWILVQAARGVDSHFNERTAFEALMFSLMGIGAALLNLAVLWLGLVASWLAGQSVVPRDRLILNPAVTPSPEAPAAVSVAQQQARCDR
jgi:hypothetical protein